MGTGKCLRTWWRIIKGAIYMPYSQLGQQSPAAMNLLVKTLADPARIGRAAQIDPTKSLRAE